VWIPRRFENQTHTSSSHFGKNNKAADGQSILPMQPKHGRTNSTRSPGLAQSKIEQIEKGMTRYDLVGCGALAHEYETKTVKARDWQGYHPLRNEHNGLTESDKTLKTDLSGRLARQELSLAFSGTDSCTCIQNCKLQTPHRRVLVSLPV